jgi:hypothetical protein
VRRWSIAAAWLMLATTRITPWHVGHASGSTSQTKVAPSRQQRRLTGTMERIKGYRSPADWRSPSLEPTRWPITDARPRVFR